MMDSKKYLSSAFLDLKKEYDAVVNCNRCGFCETVCPTYMVSGKETLSPRGRNQAFRQILEGKIANPKQASEVFSTCLTCHACTSVCFSQVPVGPLMAHARAIADSQSAFRFISFLNRNVFRFLLSHRMLLSVLLWPLFGMKRLGVSKFLKRIGFLKLISPELSQAEELIATVPLSFSVNVSNTGGNKEVSYFSGCGTKYLYPKSVQACSQVLQKANLSVRSSSSPCCGLMANSAGDVEGARSLAKKNIRYFSTRNEPIIVDDDSCCGFMKGYGALLKGDEEALQFSKRVKNLAQILYEEKTKFPQSVHPKVTVTCHDSCQIGNAYGALEPVRSVLKGLDWVEFKEMEESTWCCGGAGSYCLKHPKLSSEILERKLKNIEEAKVEVVVSGAASCLMHMQYGIKKKNWENKVRAIHLAELISEGFVAARSGLSKPLL